MFGHPASERSDAVAGLVAVVLALATAVVLGPLGVSYPPTRAVLAAVAFGVAYLAVAVGLARQSR